MAHLRRWAERITMSAHDDREKLLNDFLKNGEEYFRQMKIDNTAHMVSGLQTKIEALDATIQKSSESSGRLSKSLNFLTAAIAIATALQAVFAYVQIQRSTPHQPLSQSAPASK